MFVEFDWLGALTDSPILIILVGCSVLALGYALERLLYFHKRAACPDTVYALARAAIADGQIDAAIERCRCHRHPMGAVAADTLAIHRRSPGESEETMQVSLNQQKMLLERHIGILGNMAAIAPLIGLLGTVWGIMRAFHAMATSGSAAPSVVAAGVAEALVTTAAGLIIAVPAIMLYNHFSRTLNTMLTVAENNTRSLRTVYNEAVGNATAAPKPQPAAVAKAPVEARTAMRTADAVAV